MLWRQISGARRERIGARGQLLVAGGGVEGQSHRDVVTESRLSNGTAATADCQSCIAQCSFNGQLSVLVVSLVLKQLAFDLSVYLEVFICSVDSDFGFLLAHLNK